MTYLQPISAVRISQMVRDERRLAILATSSDGTPKSLRAFDDGAILGSTGSMKLVESATDAILAVTTATAELVETDTGPVRRMLLEYAEICPELGFWNPSVRDVMVAAAIFSIAAIEHEDDVITRVELAARGHAGGTAVLESLSRFSNGPAGDFTWDGPGRPKPRFCVTSDGVARAAGILLSVQGGERVPTMARRSDRGFAYRRRMAIELPRWLIHLRDEMAAYADGHQVVNWTEEPIIARAAMRARGA